MNEDLNRKSFTLQHPMKIPNNDKNIELNRFNMKFSFFEPRIYYQNYLLTNNALKNDNDLYKDTNNQNLIDLTVISDNIIIKRIKSLLQKKVL